MNARALALAAAVVVGALVWAATKNLAIGAIVAGAILVAAGMVDARR